MSRALRACVVSAVLGALLVGCGGRRAERVGVPFRVRSPLIGTDGTLDDRPLDGADRVTSWIEGPSGLPIDGTERNARLAASSFSLRALPFGSDLTLRVDAYAGSVLLSRGRSFPFDASADGATRPPDLFLGSLGRFGRRASASLTTDAVAAIAGSGGAALGTRDGHVVRFAPFDPVPLADAGVVVSPASTWCAVGARYLAVFDPVAKSLTLIAADGSVAAVLEDALLARHGAGAMVAADPSGTLIVVAGGLASAAGERADAVTRVELSSGAGAATTTTTSLPFLPSARWGAAAVWVVGATADSDRVVVLGGSSSVSVSEAIFIDVVGGGAALSIPSPPVDWSVTSAIALAAGQILAVGGPAGADVRLLVVSTTPSPSLVQAAPAPPALAVRRDSPRLVRFADSLVLVVGGRSGAALVRSAEIVDMRVFPGSTVQTGTLPASVVAPMATMLEDRSVWVFDRGGVFGYVPPRGP